jgi:S-adenosylmethionine:tRNA ribosyltransferase-isomerase
MLDTLLDAYDFDLPEALIAQSPSERRDGSRLLVLDRASGAFEDRRFHELPALLAPGDLLVTNDTRVVPARLRGERQPGGGYAELLLVREIDAWTWETLARPGRRLKEGTRLAFGDGRLTGEVVEVRPDGRRVIRFASDEPFWQVVDTIGEPPLPPYIRRPEGTSPGDTERYQTVYAQHRGAVAAPTAGLHFTHALLAELRDRGIETAEVTLHVGYGTFEPVRVTDLSQHQVAPERFNIPETTAAAIARARQRGGRVIAVGTTTTRTLEHAATGDGLVAAGSGEANLTVRPGYRFRAVDAIITNFHLPRSSLLVMIAAFAGRESLLRSYRHAVETGYRFYSYGDAMLIAGREPSWREGVT